MFEIIQSLLLVLAVGLGVVGVKLHRKGAAIRRAVAEAQAEALATPIAFLPAQRTEAVRVGGFHACAVATCVLPKPHPCHDFGCPRRATGTCTPIYSVRGGRS